MKLDFKKLFGQIKNTRILIIIFIVGIALLMMPTGNKAEEVSEKSEGDFLKYQSELEADLEKIISKIKDVGNVDVMVTLVDSGNTYFAKDESENLTKTDDETAKS